MSDKPSLLAKIMSAPVKSSVKQAIIELVRDQEVQFEIPTALLQDAIRGSTDLLTDIIRFELMNGSFPSEQVHALMDLKAAEWKKIFQQATSDSIARLQEYIESKRILCIAVQRPDGTLIKTGLQHRQFGTLLTTLQCKLNAYLVGPAGSGKTTAANQAAEALGIPFFFTGAISSEYKLTGFIDAQGRVVCPAFRRCYEHGGLFLFDEIDASMPQAVLAFNAAIANGQMDFPDGTVKRHPNFYCVAAANTFGVGADRVYVGRNQMDGATIDRFVYIRWMYDEDLEREIVLSKGLKEPIRWIEHVQKVRKIAADLSLRHVISPRASNDGALLLEAGLTWEEVELMALWKGVDESSMKKVQEILSDELLLEDDDEGGL